jgi:hypothetical protein
MASTVSAENQQVRNSTSGLKFGPEWMRNPPQQESFPQRQFPLAQVCSILPAKEIYSRVELID